MPVALQLVGTFKTISLPKRKMKMRNRNWLQSNWQQRRLSAILIMSSQRKTMRRLVSVSCVLMLLVLVMLLSACQPLPKTPCEPLKLPMPPAISLPTPKVSYSEAAQQNINGWQKTLIEQSQSAKQSSTLGPNE